MSTMIQTGCLNRNESSGPEVTGGSLSTFFQVTFPTPFPKNSNVVVIPFVQTFNGAHTPGLRIADVNEKGFKMRMNELVGSENGSTKAHADGTHTTETIGWIAFITECKD